MDKRYTVVEMKQEQLDTHYNGKVGILYAKHEGGEYQTLIYPDEREANALIKQYSSTGTITVRDETIEVACVLQFRVAAGYVSLPTGK